MNLAGLSRNLFSGTRIHLIILTVPFLSFLEGFFFLSPWWPCKRCWPPQWGRGMGACKCGTTKMSWLASALRFENLQCVGYAFMSLWLLLFLIGTSDGDRICSKPKRLFSLSRPHYQIPSAMGLLIADLVVVSKGHLYNMAIASFFDSDPSLVLGDFSFGCSNLVCPIYDLIISRLIKSCIKLF